MTPDELRDLIVTRLRSSGVWWADDTNGPADAVLPVVREVIAAELDAAADDLDDGDWMGQQYGNHPVTRLRDRAARWRQSKSAAPEHPDQQHMTRGTRT